MSVNRHPIDPRIYGVAHADASSLADLRVPLHRYGQGSRFGGTSVSAVAANPDSLSVFAAQRAGSGALTIVAVNKNLSSNPVVNFRLANFTSGRPVQVWRLTSSNAITHLADTSVAGATLVATLPAQSIALFVAPASVPRAAGR